jgi:hypothetical protein
MDACGNIATCNQTVIVANTEIDITGNGWAILHTSSIVSTTNGTNFGNVAVTGGLQTQTYVIKNPSGIPLQLTGVPRVKITGLAAADFTVTVNPSSIVAPGGITSFTVVFNPSAPGLRNARITVLNNDCNESGYWFAIRGCGTGTAPPNNNDNPIVLNPSGQNDSKNETSNLTSIETQPRLSGVLYPNPSNGIFTLELSEMPRGQAEIRITDALGQVLFSSVIMNQTQYYDFSHFRAATYYLQVITNEGSFTKQLIITHNY